MAKAIPDRWLNYSPIGERVPGTRFIAFKVPLNEHVNARVEEKLRLAPASLMESVPNLGLIIDLTNTNRYYHPNAFAANDVQHQKLMIPGKKTPPRALAEKFCGFVADFLASNADNDKLIGVHCTHGVNRTGYLICYFMITMMNKSPKDAIEIFAAARGHEIERQNYMHSLRDLEKKNEREPSIESGGSGKCDYNRRSPYRRESGDRWERQRNNQRNGGYYHREEQYGGSYQNWRRSSSYDREYSRHNGYQRESHYSRGNHSTYRSPQRFERKFRDHSSHKWQDFRRDNYYARDEDHYQYKGSNWRLDREERQDRFQNNRSRGYNQNYYQNHHRVETRGRPSRHRNRDSE